MCFYMQQKDSIPKVEKRFKAIVRQPESFLQADVINAFEHKCSPIILNTNPKEIVTNFQWGLIPNWAKDTSIQQQTINARMETVTERPSFSNIIHQRCLVIATAFYEWRWLDEKGKSKQKYIIYGEEELFAMAGLYSFWRNPANGEPKNSFTILTTEANETMAYVHNHKKRMPVVLKKEDESAWLDAQNKIEAFAFPYSSNLLAFPV
ncbi:MAG: SOS response-associated peptidase [Flavobacteriales bacterium]|nr:SOS response-associated peptidase [Flavobacteriales bacterium]